MELSNLPKINRRKNKRAGQGIGSGKGGHTSGRGQKGQKARNKLPVYFMGAASGASLIKRLPYLRGKGKMKSHNHRPTVLNIQFLNLLPKGTVVTLESLIKYKVIAPETRMVKILGGGQLESAYTVSVPVSKSAKAQIEKAGGKVNNQINKETIEQKITQKKSEAKPKTQKTK